MKVLVLAGGEGSRLFPLSRKRLPKQFIKLGDKSLYQMALERHKGFSLFVSLRKEYIEKAKKQAEEVELKAKYIEEPESKNTFPAILWSLHRMKRHYHLKDDETVAVTPADHYIEPYDVYREDLRSAQRLAEKGYIVTFGIKPTRPDTGFGYIKIGGKIDSAYIVDRFTEKPPFEKAVEYVRSGRYFWNSGIFVFSLKTFEEECKKYQPLAYKLLNSKSEEEALSIFYELESQPVDKAIMEKSDRIACISFRANWSDVGSLRDFMKFSAMKTDVPLSQEIS